MSIVQVHVHILSDVKFTLHMRTGTHLHYVATIHCIGNVVFYVNVLASSVVQWPLPVCAKLSSTSIWGICSALMAFDYIFFSVRIELKVSIRIRI